MGLCKKAEGRLEVVKNSILPQ